MNAFFQLKHCLQENSFLNEADCELFLPFLEVKHFKARDFYLKEGRVCYDLGYINSGSFRTYYLNDDKEINTHFVFENNFVADYDSFLQQRPSKYYIQCLEDAEVVTFNLEALKFAYAESKNWERFGREMAEQSYIITMKRVESFLFLDGEQRYLQLVENEPAIFNRVPLYHIASYLGMERESLSRLRKKIAGK